MGAHCERIFLLQKRIMRVITNSNYIAHLTQTLLLRHKAYSNYLIYIDFRNILTEVIIPYNTRNSFLKFPIARNEYTRKTCL